MTAKTAEQIVVELCETYLAQQSPRDTPAFLVAANALHWAHVRTQDVLASVAPSQSVSVRVLSALDSLKRKTRNEADCGADEAIRNTVETQKNLNDFLKAKRHTVDASNRDEFVAKKDPTDDSSCARVDAAAINRNEQMKIDLVVNDDGPLARTSHPGASSGVPAETVAKSLPSHTNASLHTRIATLESHMRIKFSGAGSDANNLHERVKLLEDALVDAEERFPAWSAAVFNHSTRDFADPFGPAIWTSVAQPSVATSAATRASDAPSLLGGANQQDVDASNGLANNRNGSLVITRVLGSDSTTPRQRGSASFSSGRSRDSNRFNVSSSRSGGSATGITSGDSESIDRRILELKEKLLGKQS